MRRQMTSDMPDSSREQRTAASRFGLIADDLTGACDAGVRFAEAGFSTLVRIGRLAPELRPFDLVALPTNSRSDDPKTAARKVCDACRTLGGEGRAIIYKKIDSTLRGNLGSELDAAMDACGFSLALVAPAFPAMARTLEGGTLRAAGSASSEAVHLPSLLHRQGVSHVVHFGRTAWAGGTAALVEQLKLLADRSVAVFDSTNEGDLEIIARAGGEVGARALLVGSAGLATAAAKILAEKIGPSARREGAAAARREGPGPVMLLMGSTHPATRAQMEFLIRSGRVTHFELNQHARQPALQALQQGNSILITAPPPLEDGLLSQFLPVLENQTLRGLALSGGDTASAILRALKAGGIKLGGEVLPGIPFGHIRGGPQNGLPVVTKAGGFGNETALAEVADFLEVQPKDA
jgi:D-threonate/D-erythronate kinase